MTTIRKKLIEVSIPLEAINAASAREKSIRHGHPSTLHLWWARRPLAACRAVLFAQLVDDPSSWPDRFRTEEEQDAERKRLHKIIERLVPWEASNDEAILNEARWEIARSVAWGLGEEPPPRGDGKAILDYLQTKAPPVYDPFCGGGSIPLEAQRLGLRAYGSDLNPVAVLISKALVEIPPKFAGKPPVNPKARAELKRGGKWNGRGAQGLAEDVRYYGQLMCEEAQKRIGHLYPQAQLPCGLDATIIAWIWARTIPSPDPSVRGARVPLISSYMLSTRPGKQAWVEIIRDATAPEGWRFEVHTGALTKDREVLLRKGTKTSPANFLCILSGAPITDSYIKSQGQKSALGERLMAVVAEGKRQRVFLTPTPEHEKCLALAKHDEHIEGDLFPKALGFRVPAYGFTHWNDLHTRRQRIALKTLFEVAMEVSSEIIAIHDGLRDVKEYQVAVRTYLILAISRVIDRHTALVGWDSSPTKLQLGHTFSMQYVSMIWDFAEGNIFCRSSGGLEPSIEWVARVLDSLPKTDGAYIFRRNASEDAEIGQAYVLSADPPYYDNIGYADLSDLFYIWQRLPGRELYPDLFRRLQTPKDEELVATPERHGGREGADSFFLQGMGEFFKRANHDVISDHPICIYYAFQQSEVNSEGISSTGWASFLQAIIDNNWIVDGTWPIRTELPNRRRNLSSNSLASSIVLVCRKRAAEAPIATRAEFIRVLKRELPEAISDIRKAGVGPVDMQQSVIGPGMAVFSRYAKVLEDDDSKMRVKTALSLINRVWEEIENELDTNFDAETQVALAWFATYGFDVKPSGELITLANAKNVPLGALFASGVFSDGKGKAGLTARADLAKNWSPMSDNALTVWECVQHTARVLNAEDGGGEAAARLVAEMGPKAADARALTYRLYEIASQKGWAAEALIYNELAREWPKLEELASTASARGATADAQPSLF